MERNLEKEENRDKISSSESLTGSGGPCIETYNAKRTTVSGMERGISKTEICMPSKAIITG